MINISSVTGENFWAYKTFSFSFDSNVPCLILGEVYGTAGTSSNGAGKSSLCESVPYCLFGKTSKGIGGDAVVNELVGKDCFVTVKGDKDGGDKFEITRYRLHKEHKNKLVFSINGIDCRGASNAETQSKILDFLKVDYDLFLQTVFFNSSNASFCGMSDAPQKNLLESILRLQDWEELENAVKLEVAELEGSISFHERSLASLNGDLESLKTKLESELISSKENVALEELFLAKKKLTAIKKQIKKIVVQEDVNENAEEELATLQQKIKRVKDHLISLGSQPDKCGTCNQPIPRPENLAELIDKAREVRNTLESRLPGAEKAVAALKEKRRAEVALNEANIEKRALEREIEVLSKATKASDRVLEDTKAEYFNKRLAIKLTKAILENDRKQLVVKKHVKKAMSKKGLRSMIIDRALPIVNKDLQQYATTLTNSALKPSLKMEDGKFKVVIKKTGGQTYSSCSAGEARRVDLCILLALVNLQKKLNRGFNFVVLDELIDGNLDAEGVRSVITLLNSLDNSAIYVISHNKELTDYFSRVITIEKTNGVSSIRDSRN